MPDTDTTTSPRELRAPRYSARFLLVCLVLACVLPGMLGIAFLFEREYRNGRAQAQLAAVQTARSMMANVDTQILAAKTLGQILGASSRLEAGDFARFQEKAAKLLHTTKIASYVVLIDTSGRQPVDTRYAYGSAAPRQADLWQIQSVLTTGKTSISDVFQDAVTGQFDVRVDTPVVHKGKVAYILRVGIDIEELTKTLNDEHLTSSWLVSVIDRSGTIVARNRDAAHRIGTTGNASLLRGIAGAAEGATEVTSREGVPMLAMHSRSPVSHWTVAIGIPHAELDAQFKRTMFWLSTGGVMVFCVGLGTALFMARRFAISVQSLAGAAQAMETGQRAVYAPVHFREAHDVYRAMEHAAIRLERRTLAFQLSHETVQRREAELAEAQRIGQYGNWSWDAATDTVLVSRQFLELRRCTCIPPFARQLHTVFARQAWHQLILATRLAIAHGTPYSLDLRACSVDGQAIWVCVRGEAVVGATGEVTALRGTVQDITERKLAEENLEFSRKMLQQMLANQDNIKEAERKRIARDVHDDLGQNLMVLRIDLSMLAALPSLSPGARELAAGALGECDTTIKAVRAIINDLRPAVLDLGLEAAVEWLAGRFTNSTGIACEVVGGVTEVVLDERHATTLFRVTQEALSNIARHAQARHARIVFEQFDARLVLTIADDGSGFLPERVHGASAFGMIGMEERVAALGGTFSTISRPGKGLTLRISIPIGEAQAQDEAARAPCQYASVDSARPIRQAQELGFEQI
jgi:signal transduction histidine kinase